MGWVWDAGIYDTQHVFQMKLAVASTSLKVNAPPQSEGQCPPPI